LPELSIEVFMINVDTFRPSRVKLEVFFLIWHHPRWVGGEETDLYIVLHKRFLITPEFRGFIGTKIWDFLSDPSASCWVAWPRDLGKFTSGSCSVWNSKNAACTWRGCVFWTGIRERHSTRVLWALTLNNVLQCRLSRWKNMNFEWGYYRIDNSRSDKWQPRLHAMTLLLVASRFWLSREHCWYLLCRFSIQVHFQCTSFAQHQAGYARSGQLFPISRTRRSFAVRIWAFYWSVWSPIMRFWFSCLRAKGGRTRP
jgi:hypothetical protein